MSFTIEIDEERKVALVRHMGPLADISLDKARAALHAHPKWTNEYTQIVDFTQAEGTLSTEMIRNRAKDPLPLDAGALQILVVSGPFQFGLARMFQTYAEGSNVSRNVFIANTIAEAYDIFERVKKQEREGAK